MNAWIYRGVTHVIRSQWSLSLVGTDRIGMQPLLHPEPNEPCASTLLAVLCYCLESKFRFGSRLTDDVYTEDRVRSANELTPIDVIAQSGAETFIENVLSCKL